MRYVLTMWVRLSKFIQFSFTQRVEQPTYLWSEFLSSSITSDINLVVGNSGQIHASSKPHIVFLYHSCLPFLCFHFSFILEVGARRQKALLHLWSIQITCSALALSNWHEAGENQSNQSQSPRALGRELGQREEQERTQIGIPTPPSLYMLCCQMGSQNRMIDLTDHFSRILILIQLIFNTIY